MLATDAVGRLEIGQGARHLEDAMGSTQRQGEALTGTFQPLAVFGGQCTMLVQAGQVEEGIGTTLAPDLPVARHGHLGGGRGGVRAVQSWCAEGGGLAADAQVQVDAIQQRAGQFRPVALDLLGRAAAAPAGIAQVTAGTGVHRRHQLEARRKAHLVAGPGNDDLAAFERGGIYSH